MSIYVSLFWYASRLCILALSIQLAGCGVQELPTAQESPPTSILDDTTLEAGATSTPFVLDSTPVLAEPTVAAVEPSLLPAAPFVVDRKFYWYPEAYENDYRNLLVADLTDEQRQSIKEAMSIADNDAILRATAAVLPPPVVHGMDPAIPNPTEEPMLRGILGYGGGLFPSSDFNPENMWQDEYQGDWWLAYAGTSGEEPYYGTLTVLQLQMPRFPTKVIRHDRVSTTGSSLHIVAVDQMMMTLEDKEGVRYTYDLLNFRFVP